MNGLRRVLFAGRLLAAALLLGAIFALSYEAAAPMDAAAVVAVDGPTPTLGSTESPNPNPPGASDADPDDYTGTTWVIAGVLAFVVLAGSATFLLLRTRRLDMSQVAPLEHQDEEKP